MMIVFYRNAFALSVFTIVVIVVMCIVFDFELFATYTTLSSKLFAKISQFDRRLEFINKSLTEIDAIERFALSGRGGARRSADSRLIEARAVLEMTRAPIWKERCSASFGADLLVLIVVFNRVDDRHRRDAIRQQSWSNSNRTKLYFALGSSHNSKVQSELWAEDRRFGDLIQFGHLEDYYNCTLKALGMLRWTARSCPFAKFVLKLDDDARVYIDTLTRFAEATPATAMFGDLRLNSTVLREGFKWFVSREDYPPDTYPDYIAGPYLWPASRALTLYGTALTRALPALPYEDAFVTGIVAEMVAIERHSFTELIYEYE